MAAQRDVDHRRWDWLLLRFASTLPPCSSVAQWQSIRLLTGGLLVRVQPEEPTFFAPILPKTAAGDDRANDPQSGQRYETGRAWHGDPCTRGAGRNRAARSRLA